MPELPDVVRAKAVAAGAVAWLDGLDDLVAGLEEAWSITVGPTCVGATEAYVALALLDDATPCVLKVALPRSFDAARHEITVLRLADGDGCARLLRADEPKGAMLLERLGHPLSELDLTIEERLEILSDAAARIWRPVRDSGLPSGADKARWLEAFVETTWQALGRPCSRRVVDHAVECARRRASAHHDRGAVLVHGDVHQWNALESEDGFKLVDPDGLVAEAEYDLGVLMREDPAELLEGDPRERSRWLARRSGLDEASIWEWGIVERVSTGLLCTQIGLRPTGRAMLDAAEVCSTL